MTTSSNGESQHRVMQRAALYLRVSTARQAEHDVSIPDQKRQGEAYCESRNLQLVETLIEPGASATKDRRPEFQRMIEAGTSKPAPFDVVVVHSFMGSKSRLLQTLVAGSGVNSVPTQGPKWRRGRDSNPRDSSSPSAPLAGACLRPLGHLSGRRLIQVKAAWDQAPWLVAAKKVWGEHPFPPGAGSFP